MDFEALTDKQLLKHIKRGSQDAFKEVLGRYETKVFNLAMRYTRNPEDAEEILQDVFVTVFKKISSFKGKSAFSSWLYRVTVNAAFMKLRKRKQDHTIPMEELSAPIQKNWLDKGGAHKDSCTDGGLMHGELREILQEAIDKLPDDYRAVYILRDIDGLSNRQVSKVLSLSVPAIKSRLHRSRLMLRKKLSIYYKDYYDKDKIFAIGPKFIHDAQ